MVMTVFGNVYAWVGVTGRGSSKNGLEEQKKYKKKLGGRRAKSVAKYVNSILGWNVAV